MPEDRHSEIWSIIERIRGGERVHHFETVRRHKNGHLINVSLTCSPVRSQDGQVHCVSVIARNITENKRAERMFRSVVEASPNGLIMVDGEGRIVLVNAEAERQFGYDRAEVLGQPIELLLPGALRDLHEQHRTRYTGAPAIRAMGVGRDLHGLRKDGVAFPIEIGLNPIHTPDGLQVLSAIVDISQRLKSEQAIRETEQKLSTVVDLLPVGVAIINSQSKFIYANPALASIVGLPLEAIYSGMFGERQYMHADGTPMPADEFASSRALVEQQTIYNVETGIVKDNGSVTWINSTATPVDISDWRAVVVTTDITERKRIEIAMHAQAEELRRSNADLEQFAYIASHDLQEPLRMVASYTELLRERYSGQLDARADKFINYAVDGARRMQQLVNDLLSYARIGTQGKAFAPTDTALILTRVLNSILLRIRENDAQISAGSLPVVLADPIQIGQLFQNLISNAIKFHGDARPEISISARRHHSGMWEFAFADNGIGIDSEYAQRVFQIFQRLHERKTYPGSGIGLAVAKRIVERHGGQIWFESQVGQGATFYFTLPGIEE